MSEPDDRVSTERVLEILQKDPLGAALLKAAVAEATVELFQRQLQETRTRVEELERQKPAAAHAIPGGG